MRNALVTTASLLLVACSQSVPAPVQATFLVSVADRSIAAPDTVAAGWQTMRVEEDGAGHIVVAYRLSGNTTAAGVAAFLVALDTARITPTEAVAIGGPEVGDTGEVVVNLTPGTYVLACVRRHDDGHRHASQGEWHIVEAVGPSQGEPPVDSVIEVRMADFAFVTDVPWHPGHKLLKVVNTGREDHQLRIDRLHAGATLQDWIAAEDRSQLAEPIAGVARTGPGQTVYLPMQLSPGTYVLYCLVPSAATGEPHAILGMIRAVTVE